MIQELLDERTRIDTTIARLEALKVPGTRSAPVAGVSRRGRKNMSMTEREEVSRRMRTYWETKRRQVEAAKAGLVPVEPAPGEAGSHPDTIAEKSAAHAAGSKE